MLGIKVQSNGLLFMNSRPGDDTPACMRTGLPSHVPLSHFVCHSARPDDCSSMFWVPVSSGMAAKVGSKP